MAGEKEQAVGRFLGLPDRLFKGPPAGGNEGEAGLVVEGRGGGSQQAETAFLRSFPG